MALIQRGLMIMATAGALAIPAHLPAPVDGGLGSPAKKIAAPTTANYAPNQLEYYLGDSGLSYIRPGCNIKIVAVTNNGAGQKPVVELLITDDVGMPLDRLGAQTPGVISMSFSMARWDPTTRYYIPITGTNTTRTGSDVGGIWTDLEVGHYKYNFGQAVPANVDPTAGITMMIYGAYRNLTAIIGKDYIPTNLFYDFRTDGKTVAAGQVWGVMTNLTNSCNKCHDPLGGLSGGNQFHGGRRNTAKTCSFCHTYGLGTGGNLNAKVWLHKLHMGEHLPSVVAGGTYNAGGDWSTVAWPGANNTAPRDCTTCHEQGAPEKDVWKTKPSRLVCGSCHDDIDFAAGKGHSVQTDDTTCTTCHPADGAEFGASVAGAHTVPYKSTQLQGLKATIVSVSDMVAGKKPTVVYKITNNAGTAIDGTKLNTFAPILAGPTKSYTTYYRESGLATGTNPGKYDAATGNTSYTFTNPVPAGSKGTWTISADIYRNVNLKRADGQADIVQRECAINPIGYYAVDGSTVAARRTSVNLTLCNNCHGQLGLHGGQRLVIEECVICHNPTMDDTAQRTAAQLPAESISMPRLIHRIHTGEELSQDFTVYGNGKSMHNYNEVRYPGDRRDCVKCHTSTGYTIPLAEGIDNTITKRDFYSPQGPGTTACVGCHDLRDNLAHAYTMTSPIGESCAACHGAGLDFGVDKVHAR
jgi:OmcA/MtrC family decaheme c-type cytochrome